uniref:Uncharacterized protein n=1 Tax=Physcomitrium patens TaxID=3218 RepID=A0A2K1IGL0_PHYPA|nr:hypothetical protein PHYPA_029004 [Physcomitrium patens]
MTRGKKTPKKNAANHAAAVVEKAENKKATAVVEEKVSVVEETVTTVEEVVKKAVSDAVVTAKETEKFEERRIRAKLRKAAAKKANAITENVKEETVDEGVTSKTVESKPVVADVSNGLEDKVMTKKQMAEKRKAKYMDYKYEYMVLIELIAQSDSNKVAGGITAFQVHINPNCQSRCFILIREDGSKEEFSFKKYVKTLMPPLSIWSRQPVN